MSDVIGVLLASISTDAALLPAFQEACRMGYVRAEGRRVKFVASECETGRWKVTEVVEAKWERITEDDFSDLSLTRWDQEWRLEGARKWFDPEPAFEPKEWRSIRFRQSDDLPPGQSWPAVLTRRPPLIPESAEQVTGNPEDNCYNWLYSLMTASLYRQMKKDEYWEKARLRFSGLRRRAFDRAWANANKGAGTNWNRHGAIKKIPALKSPHQ